MIDFVDEIRMWRRGVRFFTGPDAAGSGVCACLLLYLKEEAL